VIREAIASLNYYVILGLLNCADYGVPQKRFRVVFIGSRDGEKVLMPKKTHSADGKRKWATLRDAIGSLQNADEEFIEFTAERKKLLRRLRAGQNWSDLPPALQETALGAAFESWGGRSGFCRRLSWNRPSPTLTTAPDGRATTLCHPTKLRPLSVAEYIALQQFPATWKFAGSAHQKYLQIGNAVPLGLGHAIGRALRCAMQNTVEFGLPKDARARKGRVDFADPELEARLLARGKTMLHPPNLRKIADSEANRRWMKSEAA
jgi:DNA (cytosine-5)-methyltransferase 1